MSSLSMHPFWYNPALGIVDADSDVPRSGISIGDDSWIGANALILPGCTRIGIGSVVGAGSVVTKDVSDFTIVAGNPAKVIGTRLHEAERKLLLETEPWLMPPLEAKRTLAEIREMLKRWTGAT
jgi:acetyltransferase-like isoleucine patch superfamily enzyme